MDVPEWILQDIAVVAKLTTVRFKLIVQHLLKHWVHELDIDYTKFGKWMPEDTFSASDTKAAIATIEFLLRNAVTFNIEPFMFCQELQQLGLQCEHAAILEKAYKDNVAALQSIARESQSLQRK